MSQPPESNLPALRRKARHYVLQALYQWEMAKQPLHEIQAQFLTDYDMKHVDTEFFGELLHEIPANLNELQAEFEPLLDRKLSDLDPVELNLLRMGAYELKHRIDVPYKVVINECVNLAKRFGATDGHRYINSVLDKVAAQTRKIEVAAAQK
ncbi:transcription antitermination factor NusB [Litorivivens sp.]|uniref:transcription antitermination factor NusB n=1 Tax=Litorivivens sp. TaxID=2020868 RepID=UPI00356A7971